MLKYGQMTLTAEMVTPAIAKKWLEQNAGNRRLREPTVEQYARDMMADNWERKPDPPARFWPFAARREQPSVARRDL